MTNPAGDKPRNEQFLDALVEELRTMSDTDAFNLSALQRHWDRLLPLLGTTLTNS